MLRRYPDFNAFYEGGRIHTYDAVHIGFAVDDGRGLLVPVVHDADCISLTDTVAEVERLFLLYDEGRLSEADLYVAHSLYRTCRNTAFPSSCR